MIAFALRETGGDPAWLIGAPVPQLGEQCRGGGGLARRRGRRVRPDRLRAPGRDRRRHERRARPPQRVPLARRARGRSSTAGSRRRRMPCATRRRSRGRCSCPGEHNRRNAGAALAALELAGVARAAAAEALGRFAGTGRRFEVSEARGVTIVDDYAHHPAEIAATIAAAREAFPGRRLRALFQPHLVSRTRHLAGELGGGARGGRRHRRHRRLPRPRGARPGGDRQARRRRALGSRAARRLDPCGRRGRRGIWPTRARPGDVLLVLGAGEHRRGAGADPGPARGPPVIAARGGRRALAPDDDRHRRPGPVPRAARDARAACRAASPGRPTSGLDGRDDRPRLEPARGRRRGRRRSCSSWPVSSRRSGSRARRSSPAVARRTRSACTARARRGSAASSSPRRSRARRAAGCG